VLVPQVSALMNDEKEVLQICLVCYDYVAVKAGEMSIQKNDTVLVSEKKPSGWWKGQGVSGSCEGQSGLIPGNYCMILERVKAKYAYCV
jgi:hypothetical protein